MKKPPLRNTNTNLPCPSNFVDLLVERFDLKNDAQLARKLQVQPPIVSKLRNGIAPLTAEFMLRVHESGEIPVAEIRRMARLPAPQFPDWFDVVTRPADRRRVVAAEALA